MTEDQIQELRRLDEQERLLWEQYATDRRNTALEKIALITARKDAIYGNPHRTPDEGKL